MEDAARFEVLMTGQEEALAEAFAGAAEPSIAGVSAVVWAICCEHRTSCDDPGIVEALLRMGADPRAESDFGGAGIPLPAAERGPRTALWQAATRGLPRVVRVLLDAGADPAWARAGRSVLHAAAASGLELLTARAIEAREVDVPRAGFTALHLACASGSRCVELLLRAGADPRRPVSEGPSQGATPMRLAVLAGSAGAVDALLRVGVEPTDEDAFALLSADLLPEVLDDVAAALSGRRGGLPPQAPSSGHLAVARRLGDHVGDDIASLAQDVLAERWSRRVGRAVATGDADALAADLAERDHDRLDLDELLAGAREADRASYFARVDHGADSENALDAALWLAVQRCDQPGVSLLLEHGANPDVTPPTLGQDIGVSALALAAEKGCFDIVSRLLDAGADPDGGVAVSDFGWAAQPLFMARGVEVIERLLRAGAALTAMESSYGGTEEDGPRTALDAAIRANRLDEARALFRHGATATPEYIAHALFMEVLDGNREWVDFLLALGARLDEPPALGSLLVAARLVEVGQLRAEPDPSGLRAALLASDVEGLRAALRAGLDPAAPVPGFEFGGEPIQIGPPLAVAIAEGRDELAVLLAGVTPDPGRWIHAATSAGLHDALMKMLETATDAVGRANDHGETPLHIAARMGHVRLVSALLSAGASVESGDHQNRTPLDAALGARSISPPDRADIVKQLLEAGAPSAVIRPLDLDFETLRHFVDLGRFDARGDEGARWLDRAIDRGRPGSVVALLRAGADPDRPHPRGWPPLYLGPSPRPLELAAQSGSVATVAALLEAGARTELCTRLLRRAPDLATRRTLRGAGVER